MSCAVVVGRLDHLLRHCERLISCGVLSLDLLGSCGSYQVCYRIFFLVDGIGWGSTR